MAVIRLDYVSDSLKTQTCLAVCHPSADRPASGMVGRQGRVLVLLHGMLDGAGTWLTQTRIHRLATEHGLLVAMPYGQRSFWRDMASGGNYETLVTWELPQLLSNVFGVVHDRAQWMIAGNSMGGYGALWCAMRSPDLFGRCIALSPVVDPVAGLDQIPPDFLLPGEATAVFGEGGGPERDEILDLACTRGAEVELSLACGGQDFLLGQSLALHHGLVGRSRKHAFSIAPEAEHSWEYWDAELALQLDLRYR